MYKDNMKFVDSHEWVCIDAGEIVYVGITHHAQELLGDLVYIELPKVGQKIKAKENIGVVESVKAASDIYSPVTGEVIEINQEVIANPSLVNRDPHDKGWLFKLKINHLSELDQLLNVIEYQKIIS